MKTIILIILSFISLHSFAQGPQLEYFFIGKKYTISYDFKTDHQKITLRGPLFSGLVEDLEGFNHVLTLIRPDVDVRIVLDSGGGFNLLFNKLYNKIKRNCDSSVSACRVTTYVPPRSECSSACIPLFMIGDIREADKTSQFGFHQASVVPQALMIAGKAEKDLLERGVSEDWLTMNKRFFDSLSMTWLHPQELRGSNIVTHISEL